MKIKHFICYIFFPLLYKIKICLFCSFCPPRLWYVHGRGCEEASRGPLGWCWILTGPGGVWEAAVSLRAVSVEGRVSPALCWTIQGGWVCVHCFGVPKTQERSTLRYQLLVGFAVRGAAHWKGVSEHFASVWQMSVEFGSPPPSAAAYSLWMF